MKYFKRIRFIPLGIIKGIFDFVNTNARDLENRKRFPDAIIDKGTSFSDSTILGKGVRVMDNTIINNAKIGRFTYINRNSLIQNAIIGNYCSIAHEVNIGLGKHPLHLFSSSPVFYKKNNPLGVDVINHDLEFEEYETITIGHDVWIGAKAILMDGITVGTGAVIAAGAVVTRDVAPYAVVGGVPAKVIKYRFETEKINVLMKNEWWNFDPSEVNKIMNKL